MTPFQNHDVLYSEVVIYQAPVSLLCEELKLAERQPEQKHSKGLQSQLTRMGFIIIQQQELLEGHMDWNLVYGLPNERTVHQY